MVAAYALQRFWSEAQSLVIFCLISLKFRTVV
jgi:hypothetical protein